MSFLDKFKRIFIKTKSNEIKIASEETEYKKPKKISTGRLKGVRKIEKETIIVKEPQKYTPLDLSALYCSKCKKPLEGYPFTCTICGERFCEKHYLPENHGCVSNGKPRVGMSYGPKGGVKSY